MKNISKIFPDFSNEKGSGEQILIQYYDFTMIKIRFAFGDPLSDFVFEFLECSIESKDFRIAKESVNEHIYTY